MDQTAVSRRTPGCRYDEARDVRDRHHLRAGETARDARPKKAQEEDLLSDVFFDVWRQAASFKGRATVSTWLLAIARYKALSARRARVDTELDERITSTVADPADTPEAALQKKRRGELLRKSLAKLSPEHSEVIDLAYYHGKSVKEVAEIVGVSEATVKTRMFYARRKLASLVAAG